MMKPDPATAPVVQKIFQMHLSGILTNQIATYLTKEGIPSPIHPPKADGNHVSLWKQPLVLRLHPENPAEPHLYRRTHLPFSQTAPAHETAGGKRNANPLRAVIPHHHPALITEKDFEAAQILLKYKPKQERKPQAEKYSCTPFTNLVFCGACGRPMLHRHKKRSPSSGLPISASVPQSTSRMPAPVSRTLQTISLPPPAPLFSECRQADKVRDTIKEGTGSAAYRYASEDIRRRIIEILDLTRSSGKRKVRNLIFLSFHQTVCRKCFLPLVEEKLQLIKLFTEENAWLRDFALPEDFVLIRKTAKQLIQRIDVYPDGKTIVTLRDQADKEQLLRYL